MHEVQDPIQTNFNVKSNINKDFGDTMETLLRLQRECTRERQSLVWGEVYINKGFMEFKSRSWESGHCDSFIEAHIYFKTIRVM